MKLQKLFLLVCIAISALLINASAWAYSFPSGKYSLYNTGSKAIYYALSQTFYSYSNALCMAINGKVIKQEVRGEVLPNAIKAFDLQPIDDYDDNCSAPTIVYRVALGLTQEAAVYDNNQLYINPVFNPVSNNEARYRYSIIPAGSEDVFYKRVQDAQGYWIFYINSDSSAFRY